MPIVTIRTNVPADVIPPSIFKELTEIAANGLTKPPDAIWVEVEAGKSLTLGGDPAPTAIVGVECIGRIKPELNLKLGSEIESWINANLGVKKERIVVRFFPQKSLNCLINGSLLDIKMETDEDDYNMSQK